jgi:hypothetical protein
LISEAIVSITGLIIAIVVLGICWYMGWLRPTGLAGRNRAQREEDNRQDVATKWLDKDGDQTKGPQ